MHCFNHPNYEATAVCCNCGRALCSECLVLSEDAIACKGRCETRVAYMQQSRRVLPSHMSGIGRNMMFTGVLFAAMGAMAAWFGREHEILLYSGIAIIGIGFAFFARGLRMAKAFTPHSAQKEPTHYAR